jgi:hypothetical protein
MEKSRSFPSNRKKSIHGSNFFQKSKTKNKFKITPGVAKLLANIFSRLQLLL